MKKKIKDLGSDDLKHLTACEDCENNKLKCPFYYFAGCHKEAYIDLINNPAILIYEMFKNVEVEVNNDEICK